MKTRKLMHLDKLEELNISKDDFVIYGSAPLVIRGLKEKNNDLDVLVKAKVWNRLKMEYPDKINGDYIDIDGVSFTNSDNDFFGGTTEAINKADIIDGYHIMSLSDTMRWKEKTGKLKHLSDANIIREYLNGIEKNRL